MALDLLEVNCLETHESLPGIIVDPGKPPTIEECVVLDCVVSQILAGQDSFSAMRSIYEANKDFQIANHRIAPTNAGHA